MKKIITNGHNNNSNSKTYNLQGKEFILNFSNFESIQLQVT